MYPPLDSRPRSQTDVVVQEIKAMIVRAELRPGSRLPVESALAESLGVSRSSLREGVRALAVMGVLETRQGDGTYVTSLDPALLLGPLELVAELQPQRSAADLTHVRRVLEVEAAARAALRMTPESVAEARHVLDGVAGAVHDPSPGDHERIMEADIAFHRIIASASDNGVLQALIEALGSRTIRTRVWHSMLDQRADAQAHEQHLEILRAISGGDPDRARIAMSVHLLQVEDFAAVHGAPADGELTT